MYQGYAPNRWYWELVHMTFILIQWLGVVLFTDAGVGLAEGWTVAVNLLRLWLSVVWHPYSDHKANSAILHALDVGSCCGLVGSSVAYLFMSGGTAAQAVEGGVGRSLSCTTVGWLGGVTVLGIEGAVLELLVSIAVVYCHALLQARKQSQHSNQSVDEDPYPYPA